MNPLWILFFVMFIAFVYFAVLNVVTGVFCNSAIENAQHDQELLIHTQISQKNEYVSNLRELFLKVDIEESGVITISDFEAHLKNEAVQAYFASLDLDTFDAWTLFKLIDADESNIIDIEEFV